MDGVGLNDNMDECWRSGHGHGHGHGHGEGSGPGNVLNADKDTDVVMDKGTVATGGSRAC